MSKKLIRIALVVLSMICSGIIISYFWNHQEMDALRYIPVFIMICTVIYVLLQIVKRQLFKEQNWWDWLYYIGLISVMLPHFFVNESDLSFYNYIADIGTLFLVFPQMIEGWMILQNKRT